MKKLMLLSLLAISLGAGAQMSRSYSRSAFSDFSPSVAIKVNPASIFLGKISVLGEYNLGERKSLTFGIGIPVQTTTTLTIGGETNDYKVKTFSVMGGYRMYLGQSSMSGFYFETYAKYLKNDVITKEDVELESITGGTDRATLQLTSKYSGIGVGAQLGVQFLIAKTVSLDLFLIGPEANLANHRLVFQDVSENVTNMLIWATLDEEKADQRIREEVRKLPLMGKVIADKMKIAFDKEAQTITSEYKGFMPGFRAGITIGVRF